MIRLTAVVEVEGHGARALTHESAARKIVVGRDASADFQIPLNTISRQHISIAEEDGIYVLEDLGSTHGTLHNGKKLTERGKAVLRDGDVIELTKAKITCNIEQEKIVDVDVSEGTQAVASRAVQGILGRLGSDQAEGPYLRVIVGPEEGHRFYLSGTHNEWAMGRSKDCEFVLNDPNVSRRHAIVTKDWNGYAVADLESKNGIIVNERKIQKPKRLKDRDEIVVGPVKLVYVDPDADLMAALADVPGFATSDLDDADSMEIDGSQIGLPDDGEEGVEGEDMPGLPEDFGPEMGDSGDGADVDAPVSDEEAYAAIDPELLQLDERRFPLEWLIAAAVGLVVLVAAVLLVWVL